MRISTIVKGIAATALLSSFGLAQAAHLPSPCGAGEPGAGNNCMYMNLAGSTTPQGGYNGATGNRADTSSTLTFGVDVWIDFGTQAAQGGGFDIIVSDMANITSLNWVWNAAEFNAGEQTQDGMLTANGWEGIQFDDFAGNGFGGDTGTQNGFALVGTLQVTASVAGDYLFSILQPYTDATFPNCFAPGAGSTGESGCLTTNFYDLTVTAVPLPAAAWLMIAAIGSLAGFSRRKAA